MKVVIVAKTRQGGGACIGGLTFDGRSARLVAADADQNEHAGLEYNVGEVWEVEAAPAEKVIPPHVENMIVHNKRKLPPLAGTAAFILRHMPPRQGGIDALYEGLAQAAPSGALCITERGGIPPYSTMFWQPDRPLERVAEGKRIRYRYPTAGGGRTLVFVGFQEPLAAIPAGALVRVSLAHWWRPEDRPKEELRCYVQLSGWFMPEADTLWDDGFAFVEMDEGRAGGREVGSHQGGDFPPALPLQDVDMGAAQRMLKRVFGYDEFRPMQGEIIANVLEKRDTLAVMPTGSGKSLCFQLPALLFPGLTVVISPLISLMQDQVDQLRQLDVAAVFLNSTLSHSDYVTTMHRVRRGQVKLLYVAPETLLRPEILLLLEQAQVDCLAIDEAHCISAWGHDFRPEYRHLITARQRVPKAVCLALTATATPRVQEDIKECLGIADANQFVASFNRDNLFLEVQPRADGLEQVLAFLEAHRQQSGIIYCATRKQVETVAQQLTAKGWNALPYHAGLDDMIRLKHHRRFSRDQCPIIVATIAFGMGINKPDVRFVVHYNLPQNIESYYQEIGRAGRDGLRADCLLLHGADDVFTINYFINRQKESERPGAIQRLNAVVQYAQTSVCRRKPLLAYFGEEYESENCGLCDNCADDGRQEVDITIPAQKFLSCAIRTGELYGATHLIDILRASRAQRVLEQKHDQLSTYGIGLEFTRKQWAHLARQFVHKGLLRQDMQHGSLKLTPKGRAVLKGEKFMGVLEDRAARQASQAREEYDLALFEQLRAKRRELAEQANLPPYVIFHDRALVEMATYFPQSPAAFGALYGVGQAKVEKYADTFLPIIQDYCRANQIEERAKPRSAGSDRPAFNQGSRVAAVAEAFNGGEPVMGLANRLGVKPRTVLDYLWRYVQEGHSLHPDGFLALSSLPEEARRNVLATFDQLGTAYLRPVFEALGEAIPYDELHLMRLYYCSVLSSPSASLSNVIISVNPVGGVGLAASKS